MGIFFLRSSENIWMFSILKNIGFQGNLGSRKVAGPGKKTATTKPLWTMGWEDNFAYKVFTMEAQDPGLIPQTCIKGQV